MECWESTRAEATSSTVVLEVGVVAVANTVVGGCPVMMATRQAGVESGVGVEGVCECVQLLRNGSEQHSKWDTCLRRRQSLIGRVGGGGVPSGVGGQVCGLGRVVGCSLMVLGTLRAGSASSGVEGGRISA